eukprot:TRINITY_DN772_c0_g1_i1.p1 TRINITY_DN772_c0_g1~~TRINITY_DN772_c0_g1_i1.p1  ORF type:complete len:348 (+),score=111.50 TRINITY_DN772_c0_g1_i1:161-1204(+)
MPFFPPIKKHTELTDAIGIKVGRVGFVARGFIWACMGGVAILSAFHQEVGPQSQSGAIDIVAQSTGGAVVLIIATLGILCYFSWRAFEFLYGVRVMRDDPTWKKFINGYIVPLASCIFYAVFGFSNIFEVVHGHRQQSNVSFIALLNQSFPGRIVVTVIAVLLCGVAFGWAAQLIKGTIRNEFIDRRRVQRDPVFFKYLLYFTGYLGIPGRIILFWLLAILFARSAWSKEANYNTGFGSALAQLQTTREGRGLLCFDGILLIIFAVWSVLNSRYKEFLPYRAHLLSDEKVAKVQRKLEEGLGHTVGGKLNSAIDKWRGDSELGEDELKRGSTPSYGSNDEPKSMGHK